MPEAPALDARLEARRTFEEEAVAAERAFCIRAAYDGIRTAFLAVLAEDSMVAGDGPVPGRATYQALPASDGRRLVWEPQLAATSGDGSLALTAGPYRLLDAQGREQSAGTYLSVWRRHPESGLLELVLDFGAKGAAFPDHPAEDPFARTLPPGTGAPLEPALRAWVEEGRLPSTEGALHLGAAADVASCRPQGFQLSRDGELGVLWGAQERSGQPSGVFVLGLEPGDAAPRPLVCLHA